MVNAIAHVYIKMPWFSKQRFIAWSSAAVAVAGRVVLGIRLRFNNHPPEQAAIVLTFHQPAANEIWGDKLCRAGEEQLGESLCDVVVVDEAESNLSTFEGRHLCSKGEEQAWRPRNPKGGTPHKRWVKVF